MMIMENDLLLHIGLPRCASTSLQILLSEVSRFDGVPFYYSSYRRNASLDSYNHFGSIKYESIDEFGRINRMSFDSALFDDCAQKSEGRPLVISCEDLWRCNPNDVHRSINTYHRGRLKIVYMVRPFLEWILSLWASNSSRDNQKITCTYSDWLFSVLHEVSYCRSIHGQSIYDLAFINNWINIFPECHQISFPPSKPLHQICAVLDINDIPSEWDSLEIKINSSSMQNQLRSSPDDRYAYTRALCIFEQVEFLELEDLLCLSNSNLNKLSEYIAKYG
jgi:hypothetical protein